MCKNIMISYALKGINNYIEGMYLFPQVTVKRQ